MVSKTVKVVLAIAAFSFCTLASASLSEQMRAIGKGIGAAEASTTSEVMTQELQKVKAAIEASTKEALPPKVSGQSAEIIKDYLAGYAQLSAQADQALGLSKANKLNEAKAVLVKMKDTRGEFHKKYR